MGIANHQRKSAHDTKTKTNANTTKKGEIPHVSPDGGITRYYADRYYIDAPTGLLEYQLANDTNGDGSCRSNANANVEYCDFCGEIRDDGNAAPKYHRGTIAPPPNPSNDNDGRPSPRPLFDRSKLINSLDLSAAIIGTYSVGDFEYLSDEFPALFPRPGEKRIDDKRGYVPTLVLHGQRGFSLERWSSSSSSDTQPQGETSEMKTKEATGTTCKAEEAMDIRGGGGEHPSRDSINRTSSVDEESTMNSSNATATVKTNSSAEKKRPCLTFEGRALKLPKTPTRPKRMKRKAPENTAPQNDDENSCRVDALIGERASRAGSIAKVIVINSDSEEEPEPKGPAAKSTCSMANTTASKITKFSPPKSPASLKPAKRKENVPQNSVPQNEKAAQGGSITDIIVIDSDSEPETNRPLAKSTSSTANADPSAITNIMPPASRTSPPISPMARDTALSPPPNSPSSRKSMPMNDAPPSPELTRSASSSIFQSKHLPMPTTETSILTRVLGKPKKSLRPIYYDGGNDSSQDGKLSVDTSKVLGADDRVGANTEETQRKYDEVPPRAENRPKTGWGGVKPVSVFDGEVFFAQVLPRWCPPSSSAKSKKRRSSGGPSDDTNYPVKQAAAKKSTDNGTAAEYSDDEDGEGERSELLQDEYNRHTSTADPTNDKETKTVQWGVHHPKFFLLFERSGSLVVIVSTSNLSPQTSTEGSWVQRFEPVESMPRPSHINRGDSGGSNGNNVRKSNVDHGMPSDFGAVLTDFLKRQSEAAAGGMLPDVFLRRYVQGLSSGLEALIDRYRFDDAHVHLVSTVPGDHAGGIPRRGFRPDATYRPSIAYGPQRVSFILSRTLNKCHITSAKATRTAAEATTGDRLGGSRKMQADMEWLPPSLIAAKEQLVMQPTSMGGNWTREEFEGIVRTYLRPHWTRPNHGNHLGEDEGVDAENGALEVVDLVWPSMEYFETLRSKRRALWKKHIKEVSSITKRRTYINDEGGECPVFLSSVSFSNLDRSCISRMALFTPLPNIMMYTSASLHFKSICRLLQMNHKESQAVSKLDSKQRRDQRHSSSDSREYLSWFMLTSACLSKGAQGQPTPYRDPSSDVMSYSNFELGVLFCSRMVGDNKFDRLYVSDDGSSHTCGCQCGKGKRFYKPHASANQTRPREKGHGKNNSNSTHNNQHSSLLESVKKVHLPVPYQLRPRSYQEDAESDFMSFTPYMHDIPEGTGCMGNMKLTPFGQKVAAYAQKGCVLP